MAASTHPGTSHPSAMRAEQLDNLLAPSGGVGRARMTGLSCSPVLEENLFDICNSEFPCPGPGSRPRFVIGQVGRGAALEQEFDHLSPALRQLGLILSSALTEQGDFRYPRGATSQLKAR
jgi:hypothetical protein